MSDTLITSRDPQGAHAVDLFATAYDQAGLDGNRAQMLNERGGEFQEGIAAVIQELTTSSQFADEETASDYTYPEEYEGSKPIEEQIARLVKIFGLDPASALEFASNLPELPKGAEGWFAIPSVDAIVNKYW